jgi:hypothetical protein
LSAVPAIAIAHESLAMLDGEIKYGFRNWRAKDVKARIYIDAAMRHITSWLEGEEVAEDSGIHHLGHARACLGILLDAQAHGNLIDDRAPSASYSEVAKDLGKWVEKRIEKEQNKQVLQTQFNKQQGLTAPTDAQMAKDFQEAAKQCYEQSWESARREYEHCGKS